MSGLDLVITICLGAGLIKGLFDGIIKQVISLLSLVFAIFFAGRAAEPIREFLLGQPFITGTFPDYIVTGVCYVLAFSAIILVFHWLGKLLHLAIKVTPARMINYLAGALFGFLSWLIALSLAFNLLTVFDPNSQIISKQTKDKSVLFNKVRNVIPTIYPYVKNYFFNT